MKNPNVDADKICKHIKYTKHWLDKANDDFQEKRFANGGVVLNLARAELTAAWEEVMQLKTAVTKTMPAQARSHWKPLSSVGLLAAGFFIALFITRMTNAPLPNTRPATDSPAAIHEIIPVIATEAAPAVVLETETIPEAEVAEAAPAVAETIETAEPVEVKTAVAPKPALRPAAKPAPAATPEPTAEVVRTPEAPAELPYSPVARTAQPAAERTAAAPAADSSLKNTDIIELFNTAQKTLHK